MEPLLTITLKSTHLYLISMPEGRLLVDAGWAGSLPAFAAELKRAGVQLPEIRWVMFTHHHPDHAGLVQEVKQASGANLLIHAVQVPFLKMMVESYHGNLPLVPIQVEKNDLVLEADNRGILKRIGLNAQVVETPGHSPDSVSLVLDSGPAFTGDLTLPGMATEENAPAINASWRDLLDLHPQTIYPAHGQPAPASVIARLLQENSS